VRGERDHEAYVAARGAVVVRGLLLLGLDLPDAEDCAAAAFAVLREDWREVQESADPDVVLWATVLSGVARQGGRGARMVTNAMSRRRNHGVWDQSQGRGHPLTEEAVARVLRRTAALEEIQVCEVLGIPVSRLRALLAASPGSDDDEVPDVVSLPYQRVRDVARRRRRRRWKLSVGLAAAVALVVGVVGVLTRPEHTDRPGDVLPPASVSVEANPVDVVWWADGDLHLRDAVVRVGEVRRLVAAGTGAAYVDALGRLVGVTPDGERTLLGRPADGSPLVSSRRLGLVAWADASVPDATRLVVWDVPRGRKVAAVLTRPRTRPITFDGGWLRFGQGLRDWAWDPSGGPAQLAGDGSAENRSERTALVDAVAGTRLEQWGTFLRVVRSGRRGETVFPGFGGTLSSDGRLVLTGPREGRQQRLYDARTGQSLPLDAPDWQVESGAFVDADTVVWLVEDLRTAGVLLATCGTSTPVSCRGYVDLGRPHRVLLAVDSRR
jgi:hypothetical protein